MATSAELLALLNTAIETRLTGGAVESFNIQGVNVKRDPLEALIKLRTTLQREAARTAGGGMAYADLRGR